MYIRDFYKNKQFLTADGKKYIIECRVIFMLIFSAENIKNAEKAAFFCGYSFEAMMIKAGTLCADEISGRSKEAKTVILCGKGKNGGDGFVIAKRLWQNGFRKIFIILTEGEPTDPLCLKMLHETEKYPINITDMTKEEETSLFHTKTADIIAEAVFGIGFKGTLSGNAKKIISCANENHNAYKFAIDIPAGVPANADFIPSEYFKCDETLTMIAFKKAHAFKPFSLMCGKTTVMDIGIDEKYLLPFAEQVTVLTENEAQNLIKPRSWNDHKGTYGKALTVCGSRDMTGCVYLCNQAAVEAGAGLIVAAVPDCIEAIAQIKLTEPVFVPLESNENGTLSQLCVKALLSKIKEASVIAIGCGIGKNSDTIKITEFVLGNASCPVILDADALNCISENPDILKNVSCKVLITPHPAEFSRLLSLSVAEIENDRLKYASLFAKEYGVTVLLKGGNTVIADENGKTAINPTGNPSMARGGSGDILTGLAAALALQTESLFDAACAAAYFHGKAADIAVSEYGTLAATPSRIVKMLQKSLNNKPKRQK